MELSQDGFGDDIERQPLHTFTEQAYLDYAMYVILDRALPHIADGLKPVQRRIIYAMSELGLKAGNKFKKSARTVGDVLGKFHPHGDSACYEAMVLMAQSFSYRYPLVEGQGNWGSPDDPKSFAAMRYTEARLAKFAELLLTELDQGTTQWGPNFDGTLREPLLLPARVPHILLNGSTGIAVGMATDIPPHNLRELTAACVRLLDAPELTIEQLCEHIKGPDFPTEAEIITPHDELLKIYETGGGSLRMRACYTQENGDVVVTALPYQTSGAKVLSQIAAQMQAKKLPMVEDLRDESDHENPTRLVITPRGRRADVETLMAHLFATTDLERSYRVNLNMIGMSGRPQVKNLKQILQEWLDYRLDTVRLRLQHRLEKVEQRLHILDGLLIAFSHMNEIISIIRVKDQPKPLLMARFNLTDEQAEAILSLRLRQLAKLEEQNIRDEQAKLSKERDELTAILGSEKRLKKLVQTELQEAADAHGDDRRSPLVARQQAQALDEKSLIPTEPVTVIVSSKGWARMAKGHEIDPTMLNYRSGDDFLCAARGRSDQLAVFFDNQGRSYSLPAHTLPSARSQGEPLSGRLTFSPEQHIISVLMGDPERYYLFASDAGYGFVTKLNELFTKIKAGKAMLNVPTGATALIPLPLETPATSQLAVVNSEGYLLIFALSALPELSKGKGVKLMNLPKGKEEIIVALAELPEDTEEVIIHAGKRHVGLKMRDIDAYTGERANRGRKLPKGFQKVDRIEIKRTALSAPETSDSDDDGNPSTQTELLD